MHYERKFETNADPRTALQFAGNFLNLPIWDPSISGVRKLTRGRVRIGTQFLVRFNFLGASSDLPYQVVEYDSGKRAVLVCETSAMRATDTVVVEPTPRGSRVRWDADIQLAFPLWVFDSMIGVLFGNSVDRAVANLQQSLDKLTRRMPRRLTASSTRRRAA